MHEADDAYSIRSAWSCYWLDQFVTLALNILILSIFYISMDLSNNYFAHFSGCRASFVCSCHYPRMLCHVFWSQVEYKIVCFIYYYYQVEEDITNVPVPKIKELNRALKGHVKSYEIELQDNLNPLNHFTKTRPQTESHLEDLLKTMKEFKFIETLEITFEKDTIDSKTGKRVSIYKTAFFNGKAKTITKVDDIEPELNMSRQEILNVIDKWVSEGSGWVIDRIDSHYLNVTLYKPLNGSSYIELPTELRNSKEGLINMKNKDEECFRWCHIRHLNPQIKCPERIKKEDKKMINELNYDGINFPLSPKHYNKVEKQNSIRINVFGYEDGQPFPIHISKETFEYQMNLLLITKDEKKHYVLIKDFNAFMYNQSKHKEKKHFCMYCMYCLQCFSSERILANHVNNCLTINGAQAINMPKQGENILKFNNFHKQLPVPFVIYADFEAITKKVQGCKQSEEMEKDKDRRSYTEAYQTHEDCGYGYKVIWCYDDKYSKYTSIYRRENAVYKFMEKMLEEVEYCKAVIKKHFNKPLVMTEVDEQCFKNMDGCHICGEKYTDKDVRVRDYCHITGKFRGSAHQEYNLKLRIKPENLKGELQRQSMLISSERASEILQNETKIIKIGQAVLEISNFKD